MIRSVRLPYPPSANRYWRSWRGRVVVSAEARAYKDTVRLQCLAEGWRPVACPVSLGISVFRPIRRGDLDNTLKVLLDAMKGIAYVDDDQVVEIQACRFEAKSRKEAHAYFTVSTEVE